MTLSLQRDDTDPVLPTPSPSPSPLHDPPRSSPLDFKSNNVTKNHETRTGDPAVMDLRGPGIKDAPSGIINKLNSELATPSHQYPTVQVSGTDTNPAQEDTSSQLKRRPAPLSDSSNRPARKLSAAQVVQLTSQPLSPQPILEESNRSLLDPKLAFGAITGDGDHDQTTSSDDLRGRSSMNGVHINGDDIEDIENIDRHREKKERHMTAITNGSRPGIPNRTVSTPPLIRRKRSNSGRLENKTRSKRHQSPPHLNLKDVKHLVNSSGHLKLPTPSIEEIQSPGVPIIPIQPLSIPTYLQLELAADPKATYFNRGHDVEYESSAIKLERLRNFMILPFFLEQLLWFGAIACLDSWLYTFTILPLRFFKALHILMKWGWLNVWKEIHDLTEFVYLGLGRLWNRRYSRSETPRSTSASREPSRPRKSSITNGSAKQPQETHDVIHAWPTTPKPSKRKESKGYRHRRTRSTPSLLQATHKADLLKGLLVILSSLALMKLDPSRIYHNVRGQSAVKLYVIYNALEVGDKLLAAVGQDILECLFSKDVLERNADGRSKVIRPLWIFVIALIYNLIHAAGLLYQVISLNVAINSYSNALLTLLVSNQFVEIKGAVFKKVEKENLFQMTCADVVERFQLWLMLLIIVMRNMVEVGGLNISLSATLESAASATAAAGTNTTAVPLSAAPGLLPKSLSILPKLGSEIFWPFFIVLGSEMVVDWVKHAYVNKFNDTKPAIYSRFLDVLAGDYYNNAFGDQNLTKRIGLPVLPLACLFIRTTIQTYHMFLATHLPLPLPSPATSLVNAHDSANQPNATSTPGTVAALAHVDLLFRRALGRSNFPGADDMNQSYSNLFSRILSYTLDEAIALFFLVLICGAVFLALLAAKLVLGMLLLKWSRQRYVSMRERERANMDVGSRRLGVTGMIEVSEEARRRIYEGDEGSLAKLKEKEDKRRRDKDRGQGPDLNKVSRYAMVAKRIW